MYNKSMRFAPRRLPQGSSLLIVALLGAFWGGIFTATDSASAETPKVAEIKPILPRSQYQRVQPLGGELRFAGPVQLDQPVTVVADLECYRRQADTLKFRLIRGEVYNMRFDPDTILWPGPVDSGATMRLEFRFTPRLVGLHRIALARWTATGWQQLAGLAIAINEDGQVLCAGPSESCLQSHVTPHPKRSDRPIVLSYPLDELITRIRQDRHFTAEFRIDPAEKLRDSLRVDFNLECFVPLYQKVQFVVEHSTNLTVSKLPESWGDWAGPAPDYRHFKGRFAFTCLKPGLAFLNFKVVGKYPFAKVTDRVTTEYPMYFVFGEDGDILFAGNYDPLTRFKEATDPMLGTVTALLAATNREFRTRAVLSQPDYLGQETQLLDSLNKIQMQADSTKK